MYIVRWFVGWLIRHPIMSFYALVVLALVLYFSNGDNEDITKTKNDDEVKQVIVDDSKANGNMETSVVTASSNKKKTESSDEDNSADGVITVEKTDNQVTKTTEELKSKSVLEKASVLTDNSVSKLKDAISSSTDKVKETVSAVGGASTDAASKVEKVVEESKDKVKSVAADTTEKMKSVTNTVLASASNVVSETKEVFDSTVEKVKIATTPEIEEVTKNRKQIVAGSKGEEITVTSIGSDVKKDNHQEIEDLDQSTPEEMLLMAREAYWNNGLDEAAQIYKQLIKLNPNTIEHKGELGNVYWRQGYPKKAAELYSEIAIPMVKSGSVERVSNMIGFIGLFYPDRAAEIHKQIQLKK